MFQRLKAVITLSGTSRNTLMAFILFPVVAALGGCVGFEITVPDSGQSAGGHTLLCTYSPYNIMFTHLSSVDMDGNIQWYFEDMIGHVQDVEILPNSNLLALVGTGLREFSPTGVLLNRYPTDIAHHDVDILPNGNIMYMFGYAEFTWEYGATATGGLREINPVTMETIWEWWVIDHVGLEAHCPICINDLWYELGRDWSHGNSFAFREDESAVYINLRNLNRILKIDYPSGDVIWSLGDGGDFGQGLFAHAHDIEFTHEGHIMLLDNGLHRPGGLEYSRAIEIAVDENRGTAEIVWQYRESPDFYCAVNGSADRLPNGNTLITDAVNGRVVEVLPTGVKAWELQVTDSLFWIFNSKRFLD